MKKILILSNAFFPLEPGGVARVTYGLAKALVGLGYEVWFLCRGNNLSSEYMLHEGIHVLRYENPACAVFDACIEKKHIVQVKKLLEKFLPQGVDSICGHDLYVSYAVWQVYPQASVRCYYIHSPASEEVKIIWKEQGVKGYLKILFGLPLLCRLEKKVIRGATVLQANSKYTVSRIRALYGDSVADTIAVIPPWFESKEFFIRQSGKRALREQLKWPQDIPVFFALRRLEARMGLDNLISAAGMLRKKGYRFCVKIAGSGAYAARLIEMCRAYCVSDMIEFIGNISEEVLPLAYNAADASIVPSRALECFGIIVIESMACGCPVLVTPAGALPEIVGKFEPAWIAKGVDPRSIADLMERFLDKKLPVREPQMLHDFVSRDYTSEESLKKFLESFSLKNQEK